MRIGIDISQMAYGNTGVARYIENLVEQLLSIDSKNEYILFYSSLRSEFQISNFQFSHVADALRDKQISNVTVKNFKFPPKVLDLLWNRLHVMPIERLIGDVDVFITSDWTEPPTKRAKKMTILYDLIVYKFPDETDKKIIETQKRKLAWVKKESDMILCISESTKRDAMQILGIEESRLKVINAGI